MEMDIREERVGYHSIPPVRTREANMVRDAFKGRGEGR